jgi:hypothetical protein
MQILQRTNQKLEWLIHQVADASLPGSVAM